MASNIIAAENVTLLAASEGANYGTDATPTVASDEVLVENFVIKPYEENRETPNPHRDDFSPDGELVGALGWEIDFDWRARGSGTAGTAPEAGPLLEAAQMVHSNVPATSDTYKPDSDYAANDRSCTIDAQVGGTATTNALDFQLLGCRGTMTGAVNVGGNLILHFKFFSLYEDPTDVAQLSPTHSAVRWPTLVNGSCAYDSYSWMFDTFSFDLANTIAAVLDGSATYGIKAFEMAGRVPTATVAPILPLVAGYNLFNKWRTNNQAAASMQIGAVAGNIITVSQPKLQIVGQPEIGERNGHRIASLDCQMARSAGDDELSIVFT